MKLSLSYPWRFAGTVLTCAAILVARSPDLFVTPKLVVEDGAVFFAGAFNHPPFEAILIPYAGYWHLAPRLVAAAGTLLPLAVVPLFYAFCALLISSVALSWFYLPHFRTVVAHDSLRLAFVLLLVLMPGLDGPLLLAYIQWPLALWGMLLVLMTPPRRLWAQWVLAVVYVIALATAPALFVLLPLWAWRLVKAPSNAQRGWIGLILFVTVAMILATVQVQRGLPGPAVNWSLLITDVTRGIAFRYFVSPFTGYTLGNEIVRTLGWPAVYVLAAGIAALLLFFVSIPPGVRKNRSTYLALAYIIASSTLLYIRRSPAYHYPFAAEEGATILALRYYFLGICALLLLYVAAADGLITQQRMALSTAWIGILIVVLLYSPDFALWRWWNSDWPHTVHLLNHVIDPNTPDTVTWSPQYPRPTPIAETAAGGTVLSLRLPISPEGWTMVLNLQPNQPQGYVFPEGPRLLSVDSQVHGDELEVDLDWQTKTATLTGSIRNYKAYVHLLDKNGARIDGADVPLEQPEVHEPDEVWTTHHVMALPEGSDAGSYDLAIGLYTLDGGNLIPGSAVIIRNQVHLGQPNSY